MASERSTFSVEICYAENRQTGRGRTRIGAKIRWRRTDRLRHERRNNRLACGDDN